MIDRYSSPEALAREARAPLPVCRLVFAVAEHDSDTIRLMRSGALDEDSVRLRWAVILVAKLHTKSSLEEIGRALNIHHSVVKRAIDSMMRRWLVDEELRLIAGKLTMVKASWQASSPSKPQFELGVDDRSAA